MCFSGKPDHNVLWLGSIIVCLLALISFIVLRNITISEYEIEQYFAQQSQRNEQYDELPF